MHEGGETLIGLFMAFVGEVEGDHGGFELGVPQVALDETRVHARFEQMGGGGMSESMDGDTGFGDAGALFGCAEGALHTGATHREGRRRTWRVIAPGGRKEPGGVTMGFPVGAEQRECLGGQGDIPVLGALSTMPMDLEALPVNIGDLKVQGFMEPEAQARDRGEGDLVMHGGCGRQEPPDLLHTEDGRETVGGLRANKCEGVPVALEDVLGEEADATVADTPGRWGEAIDVFAVETVVRQFLFRDAVGCCVVELGQQADFPEIGCLRPFALATKLKRSDHLLTQWGHERSPSMS
jgi:hypothetical protein